MIEDEFGPPHFLITHPRFPVSLRAYRDGMNRVFRTHPALHRYVSGSRRFYLHSLAFHLHICRDPRDDTSGLTLKTLRAACANSGVASPGMAHLYLQMLVRNRLLTDAPSSDRRIKRFRPTDKMIAQVKEQTYANLMPVNVLFPKLRALAQFASVPGYMIAVRRAMGGVLLEKGNPIRQFHGVNYFADKASGHILLLDLMEAAAANEPLPSPRVVKLDFDASAARAAVSRMHVSKVFAGAAKMGLVSRFGPGGAAIRPNEVLIRSYLDWTATQFQFFADCAMRAQLECSNIRRPPLPQDMPALP